jgi:cytochrome c oxidase subunit II
MLPSQGARVASVRGRDAAPPWRVKSGLAVPAPGAHKAGIRGPDPRRHLVVTLLLVVATLALVALLAGCSQQTPNTLSPKSASGKDIATLTYTLFGILAGILLVVWVWLFLAIKKFRKRPESAASQTRGSFRGEMVWTVVPLVIVGVLFYLTLHTTAQIHSQKTSMSVTVTGHRWWWEFSYPQGKFKTADELHLPVGTGVDLNLLSADVMHGFWVPQLGGKVDTIPGHVNTMTITPTSTGTFLGECSEFCGGQHNKMRFLVVVQSAQEYAAWYAEQQKPAAQPSGPLATAGAQLIAHLQCSSCHMIRGTSVQGTICPDLTHFGSRLSIAGDTLPNTPQNLRVWLKDPQSVKPAVIMPNIQLSDQQLDELVAYLEGLK